MKFLLGRAAWWLPSLALFASCSVYDSSLVGTSSTSGMAGGLVGGSGGQGPGGFGGGGLGGGGLGGAASSTGGAGGVGPGGNGGSGGAVGCSAPGDCPGMDTDCKTRTCVAQVCGSDDADMGTTCTDSGNGQVCDGSGNCVQCLDASQCPVSHVCNPSHACAAPTCSDGVTNGDETDVDCGGSCAKKCDVNKHCGVGGDCKGGVCTGGVCAPTCTDGSKDGTETDVDCGGVACPHCPDGDTCLVAGDCASGACTGGACAFVLLISEIKTRGLAGGSDEFVELYNPSATDLVLDGAWSIEVRSSTSGSYTVKAFGSGVTIPSHHHYLLGGSAYAGPPAADFTQLPGIKDAASVALLHSGTTVDAICFSYNQTSHDAIANGTGYVCEGNLASNLPHNDVSSGASNVDVSLERKPGGASGNGVDTGDSQSDFNTDVPSNPQNLASGPT